MPEMNPAAGYIGTFLLVLLRAGIFLAMVPFFSSKNFPVQFKIGFAVALSLVLTPVVSVDVRQVSIPVLVFRECLLGMALGMAVRFTFLAFEMAGQVMSNVMGLSIATVFNPEFGQSTEIARLQGIIAMLLFLAMDAHHDLIYVFVKSYELLPAGAVNVRNLVSESISLGGKVFVAALKIAAPVTVGIVMLNLLLGFLYKAAPQMNIFFVSFPIYIVVGFLIMLLSLPVFVHVLSGYFGEIRQEMTRLLLAARG